MLTVFSEVCHYTRIRSPFDRHIVKYANSDPRGSGIKISFQLLDTLDDISNCSTTSLASKQKLYLGSQQMLSLKNAQRYFLASLLPEHRVLKKENNCLILIPAEFKIENFPLMEWNTPVANLANTISLFASATSNSKISTLQN